MFQKTSKSSSSRKKEYSRPVLLDIYFDIQFDIHLFTEGRLDTVKCAKSLKFQGVISEDVVLMFDEMYLRKCEEYCGGEIIGANENSEIYKDYSHL